MATNYNSLTVKNKKNVFLSLILLFICLIIILLLIFLIYNYQGKDSAHELTEAFIKQSNTAVLKRTNSDLESQFAKKELEIINNDSLPDEERYQALKTLAEFLIGKYFSTNDPQIRNDIKTILGKYAENQFPELYQVHEFNIICADSSCGTEIPSIIEKALDLINKSNLTPGEKDTTSYNLKNSGLFPESEKEQKIYGLKLSIYQLQGYNDPLASEAASLLINYLNKKYKINYNSKEFEINEI